MTKRNGPNAMVDHLNEIVKLDGLPPIDVIKMIKLKFNFDWDPVQAKFKSVPNNHKAPDWPPV